MTLKDLLRICVVWTIVVFSLQMSRADDQAPPSPVELLALWRNWATAIDGTKPRFMAYVRSEPSITDLGFESARIDAYFSNWDLCAYDQTLKSKFTEKLPSRRSVTIQRSKYYTQLLFDYSTESWMIERLMPPEANSTPKNDFMLISEMPGDIPITNAPLSSIYECNILDQSSSRVELDVRITTPKQETSNSWGLMEIDRMLVVFEKASGWLPTHIDRHFNTGDGFWYCAKLDDWRPVGDLALPFLITEAEARNGAPFAKTQLLEFRQASPAEVKERCSLSFYGIPEQDLRPNRGQLLFWAVFATIVAVAFVTIRKIYQRK